MVDFLFPSTDFLLLFGTCQIKVVFNNTYSMQYTPMCELRRTGRQVIKRPRAGNKALTGICMDCMYLSIIQKYLRTYCFVFMRVSRCTRSSKDLFPRWQLTLELLFLFIKTRIFKEKNLHF